MNLFEFLLGLYQPLHIVVVVKLRHIHFILAALYLHLQIPRLAFRVNLASGGIRISSGADNGKAAFMRL